MAYHVPDSQLFQIMEIQRYESKTTLGRMGTEEVMLILDKLYEDYEKLYWNPDNFTQI